MSTLCHIRQDMADLTINELLRDYSTTGIQVPFGNYPLLNKKVNPKVIRKALDNYCLTAYQGNWDAFFANYALHDSVYVQNNGDFPDSVGRAQIHANMLANINLIPGFASYPYYNYQIYYNFCFLILDNVFPGIVSGNYYDFPNTIFMAMNEEGQVVVELDMYSNSTAVQNALFWAEELGGAIPAYGRNPNAVPYPQPVNLTSKYPLLENIDAYWKVITTNMLLLTVGKININLPGGNVPLVKYSFDESEVAQAVNRHIRLGYVLGKWDKFFATYTDDAVLLRDYNDYAVGRPAIKAITDALLAQVPNLQIRVNYLFIKANCATIGIQLDMYSKLNRLYTAPATLQLYYAGKGKFNFQQDVANYENIQLQIQKYLNDNASP